MFLRRMDVAPNKSAFCEFEQRVVWLKRIYYD